MSSTPSGRARGGAFSCGYSVLRNGDYFFTFWQKFIRIVATCWRAALPCSGSGICAIARR